MGHKPQPGIGNDTRDQHSQTKPAGGRRHRKIKGEARNCPAQAANGDGMCTDLPPEIDGGGNQKCRGCAQGEYLNGAQHTRGHRKFPEQVEGERIKNGCDEKWQSSLLAFIHFQIAEFTGAKQKEHADGRHQAGGYECDADQKKRNPDILYKIKRGKHPVKQTHAIAWNKQWMKQVGDYFCKTDFQSVRRTDFR